MNWRRLWPLLIGAPLMTALTWPIVANVIATRINAIFFQDPPVPVIVQPPSVGPPQGTHETRGSPPADQAAETIAQPASPNGDTSSTDRMGEQTAAPPGVDPGTVPSREDAGARPREAGPSERAGPLPSSALEGGRRVSVLAGEAFSLCGWRGFRAKRRGEDILLTNSDLAFPYRGEALMFEVRFALAERTEVFPGCAVSVVARDVQGASVFTVVRRE